MKKEGWMDRPKPYVIGVAGGSGSGKTTLINTLLKNRILEDIGSDAVVLQHDWYYKHNPHLSAAQRSRMNYDHPHALDTALLADHVKSLLNWQPIAAPRYDYQTHLRKDEPRPLHPAKLIIIDGILILADKALRDLMDLKVYVDADPDLRFIRRLERDLRHRGRTRASVVRQYLETVKPMHDQFVEPGKSHAHIIIPDGGRNRAAIDLLAAGIRYATNGR